VCPTEIIAHDRRYAEFKTRGVELVGVSIDSKFTHFSWRCTPVEQGGIGPVQFPVVADINHTITRDYGVEHDEGCALRATFLIDKDGVVQSQHVNNKPLERNVDEAMRLVDALQFHEEHGEVCPAGWHKGDEAMKEDADSVAGYLARNASKL
jgi:peroxiredoxin (alkyl hydroperoxide reductase subunit C)